MARRLVPRRGSDHSLNVWLALPAELLDLAPHLLGQSSGQLTAPRAAAPLSLALVITNNRETADWED